MALTQGQRKNFLSRKASLQKKTFEITNLFGVKAYLLIELDSEFFSFRSSKDWPPSFEEVVLSQCSSSQIHLLTETEKKSL